VTLTFELDVGRMNVNEHAEYLG